MDSNNNVNQKPTTEIDIRDVANYLLSKLWIIALVVLCFAIIAFLWTTFFVTKEYTSTTEMFVINASPDTDNNAQYATAWSIGKQLTKTSSELIMGDYCDEVAKALNEYDPNKNPSPYGEVNLKDLFVDKKILDSKTTFTDYFSEELSGSNGKITGGFIRSHIRVSSDEETCIVSVTATTTNPRFSAAISNAVMSLFGEYINRFMKADNTIVTTISTSGGIPSSHSNANATKNAIIFAAIGAIIICVILIIIFIFDDKIKTPDDIEKQLGLSVLGAIPEIDEA